MNRSQVMQELKKLKDEIAYSEELTDYTREKAYIDICDAIEILKEND